MSDSEGSVVSLHGSEKSVTHDETVETMPNHNEDKLEEFLDFQSIIVSHSASEEEEQLEEEDNASEEKIIGRLSYSLIFNIVKIHSLCVPYK